MSDWPEKRGDILEVVELLKQNLAIEPDLQSFAAFILDAVETLGGNAFASVRPALDLMQRLRNSGASTGYPLCATLHLERECLFVRWEDQHARIATLEHLPEKETVERLRQRLHDSTVANDPDLLLLKNAEMARHLEETREQARQEMASLQQALEKHQNKLYESLRQAETDPLTGLLNRRAFNEKLDHAFRSTLRQRHSPLTLMLLDLDHFKEVNDQFGHQYGDHYLIRTADTLRSVIREDVDFAFRIGGDEFAILLFADTQLASEKAEFLLKLSECKMSIGIASVTPDTPQELELDKFIHCADEALYKAKNLGRGQFALGFPETHSDSPVFFSTWLTS